MVFSKKTLVATVIVLSFAVVGGLPTMVFASGSSSPQLISKMCDNTSRRGGVCADSV